MGEKSNRNRGEHGGAQLNTLLLVLTGLAGVAGVVVCARGLYVEGACVLALAGLTAWCGRREAAREDPVDLAELDTLDPGGGGDALDARVKRIAATHATALEQARAAAKQIERALNEKEADLQQARVRAADGVKAAQRDAERLARRFEDIPGALVRIDPSGTIDWLNAAAEHLVPGAVGRPVADLLPGWEAGRSGEFELAVEGEGTRVVWVDAVASDVAASDVRFLSLRDLSAEKALQVAADAAARAQDEYRDVRARITPQATPEDVLADAGPRLAKLLTAHSVSLVRAPLDRPGVLQLSTSNGVGEVASVDLPSGGTCFARTLDDGEERVFLNLDESELSADERRRFTSTGVRALGVFPLRAEDDVVAALAVGFERAADLSPAAIAMLRGLAPALSRAVAAGIAFESTQTLTRRWAWVFQELPDPVLVATTAGLVRAFNAKAAQIAPSLAGDGAQVDAIVASGERDAMREEFDGAVAAGRGRFVVTLAGDGEDEPRTGEVHLRVATEDGDSAVLLIVRDVSRQRAEAEEVHRREEEVEELYQLSLDLGRSLDLPWVMEQVFEKALEVTKLDCGWVTFIEQETDSREVAAGHRIDLEKVATFYDENTHVGFEDRVLRTKKPVVLERLGEDPTIPAEAVERAGLRSLVSVPLLLDGEVVGVLNLASPGSYQFQIKDIENLGIFGRIFSRGVANSKRFYEMKRRAEQSKLLISEQLERLRTLGEELGGATARIATYRELLLALWGRGGALKSIADGTSPTEQRERDLAFAVGRMLPLYLREGPVPTKVTAFGSVVGPLAKEATTEPWHVADDLARVDTDREVATELIRVLVEGLRPVTERPFEIDVRNEGGGVTFNLTLDALDPLGAAAEMQRQIATLEHLSPGRPYLMLVLLHMVGRVAERVHGRLRVRRGEGQRMTVRLLIGHRGGEA